jgi:hypothetical protein
MSTVIVSSDIESQIDWLSQNARSLEFYARYSGLRINLVHYFETVSVSVQFPTCFTLTLSPRARGQNAAGGGIERIL